MNKKAKSVLFASFSLLLISLFVVYVVLAGTGYYGGGNISHCGEIDGAGTYTLNQSLNIPVNNSNCIEVYANNVTIDCAGKAITGYGTGYGNHGIYVYSDSNVTVKNCHISKFDLGIYLESSGYGNVQDNVISDVGASGIQFEDSGYGTITGNTIENGTYGILLQQSGAASGSNRVEGNTINNTKGGSSYGIFINEPGNQINNNVVECANKDPGASFIGILLEKEANSFSGNEVYTCKYGLYASGVDNFTMVSDSYHGNYDGIYLDGVGSSSVMPTITETSSVDNNCEGLYSTSNSEASVSNSNFERNGESCIVTGLHNDGTIHLLNSDFIDNTGYGLKNAVSATTEWLLTKDVTCRNNNLWITNGFITPMGGKLIQDNCTVTVAGKTFATNQTGYYNENINLTTGNDTFGDQQYGVTGDIYGSGTGTLDVNFYTQNPGGSGFALSPLGLYVDANYSGFNLSSWVLKIYYTDAQVTAAGLDESSLRIQYYNATSGEWKVFNAPEGGVNTVDNYVWANLTHFSLYGVFGSKIAAATSAVVVNSGGGATSSPNATELANGLTKTLWAGEVVKFMVGQEQHMFMLLSIKDNTATVQVSSTPQKATMAVGEEKKIDVNNDGYYDLYVKLNSVSGIQQAEFTLKTINESIAGVPIVPPKQEEKKTSPTGIGEIIKKAAQGGKGAWIFWIVAIIVIIALIWWIVSAVKKKKG